METKHMHYLPILTGKGFLLKLKAKDVKEENL